MKKPKRAPSTPDAKLLELLTKFDSLQRQRARPVAHLQPEFMNKIGDQEEYLSEALLREAVTVVPA